jgi:hypothetical protein
MGSLLDGNPGTEICFDNPTLLHLQALITAKRRRRERFLVNHGHVSGHGKRIGALMLASTGAQSLSAPPVVELAER